MEFSKTDMKILKGVAILFMLLLHLFCRKDVNGLYDTFPFLNGVPLIYYIGLFGDACVPIYLFASGYGLFVSMQKVQESVIKKNINRILKLMVNYWIILILFVSIGHFAGVTDLYPGSVKKFILNFFLLSSSYNGAWWFLQTYVILVIGTPFLFKFVKKYNSIVILLVSSIIYFLTYIQRVKNVMGLSDNTYLSTIVTCIVLVGTSQFSFIVGSIFAKEKLYSQFYKKFHNIKYKNIYCVIGILFLVVIHSFYESMIIAPITGITFICLFTLINKSKFLKNIFDFFGNHSTNIWLTHMFFFMTIFPRLTFAPTYPVFIFIWLLLLCIVSSYVINQFYYPLLRILQDNPATTINNKKGIGKTF